MIINKKGETFEAKTKYKRKLAAERDFCLNHCPHPKASDCRWQVKQCMALARRHTEAT